MVLILAKLGFFKRKIKAELVKIKRETLLLPPGLIINADPVAGQSLLPDE